MNYPCKVVVVAAALATATLAFAARTQDVTPAPPVSTPPMDNERLGALIQRLDPEAEGRPGFWRLTVRDREVLVITDERADRMRVIASVARADALEPELLYRLMQANFDTALDARYAIARGTLWSAYIHPFGVLDDRQFVSGLAQVVNLALTFGSTFSSGSLSFGGGDSGELIQELLERLAAV